MDQKIKKQWVKALRSGKFKQGTGALLQEGKFCCLGVLCSIKNLKRSQERDENGRFVSSEISFEGYSTYLPDNFRKKIGLQSSQQTRLISMNDGDLEEQKSFKEIADWIDENL